jgi:hypothetical protein
MKKDPSVGFSDREAARAAGSRLLGEKAASTPAGAPALEEPALPRFRASEALRGRGVPAPRQPTPAVPAASAAAPATQPVSPRTSAAAGTRAVPRLPPPPAGAGSARGLDVLLGWCQAAGLASFGFVLDPQGLLVASAGRAPFDEVEAVGGRVTIALDQACTVAGDDSASVAAVAVDLGARWLTAFRVHLPQGDVLTVGLVGHGPLRGDLRRILSAWICAALGT